ncbi:MAG: hypothetical protein LBT04_09145 [Prevotellaceae bacterium]|jgi:hypothetical protein|nr:hypothetical protein [Prevotellaceae bacterium]
MAGKECAKQQILKHYKYYKQKEVNMAEIIDSKWDIESEDTSGGLKYIPTFREDFRRDAKLDYEITIKKGNGEIVTHQGTRYTGDSMSWTCEENIERAIKDEEEYYSKEYHN